MISRVKPSYWALFNNLPESVQAQARESYRRFAEKPDHPGLSFKKLKGTPGLVVGACVAAISRSWRARR